jgi:hypothetical protein
MTTTAPRLTVTRELPLLEIDVWHVLRDLTAWYWPDPFHSIPTNWAHRLSDGNVTVTGRGVWTHSYLPVFPWGRESVDFTLDVDDVNHAVTVVEFPTDARNLKRQHTQKWSLTSTGPRDCTVRVDLWHAPVPLIGWYTNAILSAHADTKIDRIESTVLLRVP